MINLITEDYNASITEHGNHILVKFNQKASAHNFVFSPDVRRGASLALTYKK